MPPVSAMSHAGVGRGQACRSSIGSLGRLPSRLTRVIPSYSLEGSAMRSAIAVLVLLTPVAALAQDRKEIRIAAADLAPAAQRADTPTPGKWWLKRDAKDWGVPGGVILLTGQASGTKAPGG